MTRWRHYPADTLRNNITSKWRHFDVTTENDFDVITTLLLRHVFGGHSSVKQEQYFITVTQ